MKSVLAWCSVVLYCGIIFYLSSLSHPPGDRVIQSVGDKVVHATVFGILGGLMAVAIRLSARGFGPRMSAAFGFICAVIYGAIDEIHQRWTPGRSSDVRDWIADAVGAGVVVLVLLSLGQLGRVCAVSK